MDTSPPNGQAVHLSTAMRFYEILSAPATLVPEDQTTTKRSPRHAMPQIECPVAIRGLNFCTRSRHV